MAVPVLTGRWRWRLNCIRAMLRGEISPQEAQREWAEREPGHRAFNDQIRRQAGFGYVADAEQTLDPNAPDAQVRDAQTGQFADLGDAARDAGHRPMPGGIVPTERRRRLMRMLASARRSSGCWSGARNGGAMPENVVSLRFRVDNKGAIIGIESVGGAAEKTAEKIRLSNDAVRASNDKTQASHFSLFKSAEAGGLASGNAYMMGAVAIAAVADGMRKAVKSSMAWGRQTAVLNRSLKNAHINHRGLANSIGDTTEKLSEKGGFAAPEQM